MVEIILDTIIDSLKLLPFLFITFLIMELIEHKLSDKGKKKIESSGKLGPVIGAILGSFPQCGFSSAATNLYSTRIITLGTLIAIYLSTSDEMLPILISEKAPISLIVSIISIKIIIGIISGLIIDLLLKKEATKKEIEDFCDDEHCDCEHSLIKSTMKHTINILIFITLIEFVFNVIIEYFGLNILEKIFIKNNILGSLILSLVGLIPNCGSSVVITELYLKNAITFGSMISGLLTGSGVALLILFRVNKNIKENIKILAILYFIGVFSGIVIDLFC